MTSTRPAFQKCTGSCHENVPALQSTDDMSCQDRDSRHIGTPSYNTSHTMKPSDPLLLTDVTYTVGKPSVDAGSLCSEA